MKLVDLTDKQFGRWKVIYRVFRDDRVTRWRCKCACGTERDVVAYMLKTGDSTSCGCSAREISQELKTTGDIREIQLTRGYKATVSAEDYARIIPFKWQVLIQHKKNVVKYYAQRQEPQPEGSSKTVRMHRFILDIRDTKIEVDHRDGNGLNNCRGNIRVCTGSENSANKPKRKGRSQYKGVSPAGENRIKKWQASIRIDGKSIGLGRFHAEEEAAIAYDNAASAAYGEFAVLNFPELLGRKPMSTAGRDASVQINISEDSIHA